MKKDESNVLKIDRDGKKEVLVEVIAKQVQTGPKAVEGFMEVPGLNMINPIASYAPIDPAEGPNPPNPVPE